MEEVKDKFNKFIMLLKERTIKSIDNSDIKESCTATLLLLFAAIDSLSKITCSNSEYDLYKNKKGNKVRFTGFLDNIMCDNYSVYKDNIYDLRNDIVHTGINTNVILSKSPDYERHLKLVDGYLWINTNQFLDDFKKAIEQIKNDIDVQGQFYQNAEDRIRDFNIIEVDEQHDIPSPSPGPDEEPFYQ
ncbi:MAG: hypothetical protein JW976_05525 [Syntrophaceae bacterium]|nr:hypothetical protein [Syntrophaceae bacterium]